MKIAYINKRFSDGRMFLIIHANRIIDDYQKQGYKLTLRQLYYQMVARDIVPNTVQSYNRVGGTINDARLAGLIDWEAIEDRTRMLSGNSHWNSPSEIITACADQYCTDIWKGQLYRPEVWIEKEALAGIVEPICRELDISWLSCRGYTSQSIMWESAMRLQRTIASGQLPYILHFGDHDPSGIDMTRDISDRLDIFGCGHELKLKRIALNMDQIEEFKPPPNPAKMTDTRFHAYAVKYGTESWELDALEPKSLTNLIRQEVQLVCDMNLMDKQINKQETHRKQLKKIAREIE